MKRIQYMILLLVLLFCTQSVFADSIWAPYDDFFEWNAPDEDPLCTFDTRIYYIVDSRENGARAYETPKSDKVIHTYPNDSLLTIPWICKGPDGADWGAVSGSWNPDKKLFDSDWTKQYGYVQMKNMKKAIDGEAFADEHQDDLTPFTGEFDLPDSDGFVVFMNPESDVIVQEASPQFIEYLSGDDEWIPYEITKVYTDKDDVQWVYIEIFKPAVTGWINTADPLGKNMELSGE